jgi:hypothetical protein
MNNTDINTENNTDINTENNKDINTEKISKTIYLSYIHSLLNPYRNMKIVKNKYNKIYTPSKLSIAYSCTDLYNLIKEENKKYFLIYYDDNYEKDFLKDF